MEDPPPFGLIDSLTVHLYELSQLSPVKSAKSIVAILTKKHHQYIQYCEDNGRGVYPTLDTVRIITILVIKQELGAAHRGWRTDV